MKQCKNYCFQMLCRPFQPYDQSFDNCSSRRQSQQSCDCYGSISTKQSFVGSI